MNTLSQIHQRNLVLTCSHGVCILFLFPVRFKKCLLIFVVLFFIKGIEAKEKVVEIGFGNIPPYAIQSKNDGILVQIFTAAFSAVGFKVIPVFASNKRLLILVSNGDIDGFAHAPKMAKELRQKNIFAAGISFDFMNYAISLKTRGLNIVTRKDLHALRVVAFQNARVIMGEELTKEIPHFKSYKEVASQLSQIHHLGLNRADIIISDRKIFEYFNYLYKKETSNTLSVNYHQVFSSNPHIPIFKQKEIRDLFVTGYHKIIRNKKYDGIMHPDYEFTGN